MPRLMKPRLVKPHSMTARRGRAALSLAAWTAAAVALAAPARAGEARPRRMVFAHYMACLANGVDFAKQEIELARRHGIDGFALNSLTWGSYDAAADRYELGGHGKGAADVYEAARQLGKDYEGFKLFVSADVNGDLNPLHETMRDMVRRFKGHPNQLVHDGRPVLSAWAGTADTYAFGCKLIREKEKTDVCFVPFVSNARYTMAWSVESLLRVFRDQPHMDGWFFFACDGSVRDLMETNAVARRVTQHLGKICMAGVAPAYNSPNLRDMNGIEGYAAVWEGLIRDGADWVEIVTWNDYNEDSNLMPYRWKEGWERQYYDRDESFLDATQYYAAWFRSGRAPEIRQDKVFFTYRTRSKQLTRGWDSKEEKWVDITATKWPFDQIHDDVGDFVYATTFLTAPATLTLSSGAKSADFQVPAGVSHARVELAPGVPRVALKRGGRTLVEASGRKLVVGEPTVQNSPSGYHLLNRTWTNAAVVGRAQRFEAESGELAGGAEVVGVGRARDLLVRNAERDGSGFTLKVAGLETATYNVRVTYRNPSANEARLTLVADGPPRPQGAYPYYIPAFLPPTGEAFATVSFLWSLYDKTTRLALEWRAGNHYDEKAKANPLFNDHGVVDIDAIELVKVEPARELSPREGVFPEMVDIPGGSFTMGSDAPDAQPDESPLHRVTLSPFAVSRCEVTNEEYERFDPKHREWRDGFSWRDTEPVIYVSWRDGARYANWLSKQAGLKPAYDEKTWEVDTSADGFRMPTEAEWEYVATGRGEGRRYPWGDAAPVPGLHGNFSGEAALSTDPRLRSTEAGGVTVVGSYPAGASRDGVMDLAGNVTEWTSDWYQPYGDKPQRDPCEARPGNHRVLRGGSWGYYNLSQRSADREFNNPGYPGYIYLGLRMVLPEAGRRRLAR